MVLLSMSTSMVWLDQPRIVLRISSKVIENPERGEVYYHYDSMTITTTIAKDVSCFVENLDGSMTEIFWRLNVDVPFLSRLSPDNIDKLAIEQKLRDRVCEAVRRCGSGGFMVRFVITLASDSDQYPYTVIIEEPELAPVAMDADPLCPPINQHPRLTPLPTGADSSCCPICLDKLFGEESAVEWLPCAHGFHHGCINLWLKRARICPVCRLSIEQIQMLVSGEE